MKPWTIASNLDDRDLLAQIEAVDAFMARMHAYPGRTFGQLYHRFFRTNDLARRAAGARRAGRSTSPTCTVPLLAVAGRGDGIAPVAGRAITSAASCPNAAARAARDRARRPPRRADGARGARARRGRCSTTSSTGRAPAPCSAPIARRRLPDAATLARDAPRRLLCLSLARALARPPRRPPQAPSRDRARRDSAGGVDVGGLTVARRPRKLDATLRRRASARRRRAGVAGRRFTAHDRRRSASRFDAPRTAQRAPPRANRPPAPTCRVGVERRRRPATRATRGGVVAGRDEPRCLAPRDATVRITLRHMLAQRSQGRPRARRQARCAATSTRALDRSARAAPARPKRSGRQARGQRARPRAPLRDGHHVDRARFRLRLFKRLRFVKRYGVAVGQPAYPTPTGLFRSPTRRSTRRGPRRTARGPARSQGDGPRRLARTNPLKARWMGIVNGVGIHGTARGLVDRLARLARLHPHARRRT